MKVLILFDCSKGEFGHGQHELNVKYAEVLEMADRHSVYKQVNKSTTVFNLRIYKLDPSMRN
jgi:glutamine synthetase